MVKLTVMMSGDELAWLRAVSKQRGLTMSAWVRGKVRDAYESSPKATCEHGVLLSWKGSPLECKTCRDD